MFPSLLRGWQHFESYRIMCENGSPCSTAFGLGRGDERRRRPREAIPESPAKIAPGHAGHAELAQPFRVAARRHEVRDGEPAAGLEHPHRLVDGPLTRRRIFDVVDCEAA